MKKEIQNKLKYLGLIKAHHAAIVKTCLLGDDSTASSQNQADILDRLYITVESSKASIVDLRQNNGKSRNSKNFGRCEYILMYFTQRTIFHCFLLKIHHSNS